MEKIPGKIDVYSTVDHCANCRHFTPMCNHCGCGICWKDGKEHSKVDWCEDYNK